MNVDRLRNIAFACKLEELLAEPERKRTVQVEAAPVIICTEAL